jgi:hypothetical protein
LDRLSWRPLLFVGPVPAPFKIGDGPILLLSLEHSALLRVGTNGSSRGYGNATHDKGSSPVVIGSDDSVDCVRDNRVSERAKWQNWRRSGVWLRSVDFSSVNAHRIRDRIARSKRSGFQSNLSIGALLSTPFPRSEACRTKGTPMRTITKPPPSSHCDQCGGELRLKHIEVADRGLDLECEIFVCANCGREQSLTMSHDHQVPHTKVA